MKLRLPNHLQRGASQLVLVLVVATILSLITLSIQIVAFLLTKTAAQSTFTQKAYFSAEGALFETISHLETDPSWPEFLPYEDEYDISDSTISRLLELDPETGLITITINADSRGAKRKLVGTYAPATSFGSQLDVMLIIDRSSSMGAWNQAAESDTTAMDFAKSAAKNFVSTLNENFPTARVGVVSYNEKVLPLNANNNIELTYLSEPTGLNDVLNTIDQINSNGGTNIGEALYVARAHLDEAGRPNANKTIILLSDGVPQFASPGSACISTNFQWNDSDGSPINKPTYQSNMCYPDACFADTDGQSYNPLGGGNCCTQDAIAIASDIKYGSGPVGNARGYRIFSIFLNSYQRNLFSGGAIRSACTSPTRTAELGAKTLLSISSEIDDQALPAVPNSLTYFKETSNLEELQSIYEDLAVTISQPGFFQYIEDEPDPDPVE